ncbi:hypothetical protein BCF44_119179 [Kutzneria buriramensis]|uniref:Uncharacterized protein n=1 Tax=Kutzneria buriramensis TaxID=1045776 RepID=A0A3E0GZU2_9PSEU|nr:hypothetical protein BCF44_119179 [Kutzneria buriramensis]
MTGAASGLVDRASRLIWAVLVDAGRCDLADVVADRLAGMPGPDLRIRATGALRAVLGGVMAERDAVELVRRGITRDELALLAEADRRLVERVNTTRDVDAAGRRRAVRVVTGLLDRVAQVLSAAHTGMPQISDTTSTAPRSERTCRTSGGTASGIQPGPATTTVV